MATFMNTACRLSIRLLRLRLSFFGCLGFAVMAPQEPSHTRLFKKNFAEGVFLYTVVLFLGLSLCSTASGNSANKVWYSKQSFCFISVFLLWLILTSIQLE